MQDESNNDHERQNHVERKGNRIGWNAEVEYGDVVLDVTVWPRRLVDEHYAHYFINGIS